MSTSSPAPDNVSRPPETVADGEGDHSPALFAELDALLERMLALPVSYREEPQAGAPDVVPVAEMPPLITIAEAMPDPIATYPSPLPPVTFTDPRLHAPLAPVAAPLTQPSPLGGEGWVRGADVAVVPVAAGLQPADSETSASAGCKPAATSTPDSAGWKPAATSLWLRGLVGCNRLFDRCTMPLGALGRWLRAPSGRRLLGWTGVLLLAAACGLAVYDWFGWTR